MRAFRPFARTLGRDEGGVSIVEFAFVAPVVVLLIVGIIDGARAISAKISLDQAVYRGLEKAEVGTVQSDYTFVKTEVATAAGIPAANVTVTNWLECDGTTTPWDQGCTSTQQTARYIKVVATNTFAPSFSYGKAFLHANSSGQVALTSEASLRMQ